jgi:hypothetical protein
MGCLRQLFVQVGCLVLLVAGAALGFVYREQVVDVYRRLRGAPAPVEAVYAAPAPEGAERARAALARLGRGGGPAFLDLGAGEVAALIEAALAEAPRRVFDSVRVALLEDELRVRGSLDVSRVPPSVLGPLSGAIGPREPIELGGAVKADSLGEVWLRVRLLRVRDFPFPRSTLPALLRQLRVPGAVGAAVPLAGIGPVGDLRVRPTAVRVYRRTP